MTSRESPVRPCVPTTMASACTWSATSIRPAAASPFADAAAGAPAGARQALHTAIDHLLVLGDDLAADRAVVVGDRLVRGECQSGGPRHAQVGDAGDLDRRAGKDRPAATISSATRAQSEPSWPSTTRVRSRPARDEDRARRLWSATSALTEPSNIEPMVPWPRLPSTIRSASSRRASSRMADAARPSRTSVVIVAPVWASERAACARTASADADRSCCCRSTSVASDGAQAAVMTGSIGLEGGDQADLGTGRPDDGADEFERSFGWLRAVSSQQYLHCPTSGLGWRR